ncbi:hypothetical protein KGF56_004376 [Candida oxycetoniae]|uniref:Uncharacterized protein n=1 Tax=Candida oxycetoniae TaxID=497107 RepID=A0AAI9STT3_9ASCO|nr:uncharacterized protein KGF56_004376 [Candida oxycetoniae]KAI3402915.2 hypothetical protein KGF56_004376 [Candida oxycetoniae]
MFEGLQLAENLDEAIINCNWHPLELWVANYRKQMWFWQKRRSEYLKHKSEIEESQMKLLRGQAQTLAQSRRKKVGGKSQNSTLACKRNEQDSIKQKYRIAKNNGRELLHSFINQLQVDGKLANPHLLPYTAETLAASGDQYEPRHIIKGSGEKIINEAYDKEYIESIIIPHLEFELNDINLDKIAYDINEKGPYRVVAKQTEAGTVSIPFLMSPFKHKVGRVEVARAIKQQILWLRIQKIWNAKGEVEEENMAKDGSYPVKGCQGFGLGESMRPKLYYQELGEGEEMYELFLQLEKGKTITDEQKELDLTAFDWTSELMQVTKYIASKYQQAVAMPKFDLMKKQQRLQEECNKLYKREAVKFDHLLAELQKHNVFKHSEIVCPEIGSTTRLDLLKTPAKYFPAEDRVGRGQRLGDFLKSNKLKCYQFGYEKRKNIKQVLAELSRRS